MKKYFGILALMFLVVVSNSTIFQSAAGYVISDGASDVLHATFPLSDALPDNDLPNEDLRLVRLCSLINNVSYAASKYFTVTQKLLLPPADIACNHYPHSSLAKQPPCYGQLFLQHLF